MPDGSTGFVSSGLDGFDNLLNSFGYTKDVDKGLLNSLSGAAELMNPFAAIGNAAGQSAGQAASSSVDSAISNLQGYVADIENWLVRGGLIIIGGIVVAIALWALLKDQTSLA